MKKISLSYLLSDQREQVLCSFLAHLWMAPADVLLRATETQLWRSIRFTEPTLDIGCGDGTISLHIFKHLPKLAMGVDLNPQGALETGRYKKTLAADATKLPFADNSFQTVVSNSTFEHIPNDLQAVAEVGRVLKKGGTFWLTVPTPILKLHLQRLAGSRQKFTQVNNRVAHYHYRSTAEWAGIFAANNLRLVGFQTYFPPSSVSVWYRLFRLATWKPYHRELWSYLADPRISPWLPKSVFQYLEKKIIDAQLTRSLGHPHGTWQLLQAVKM